MLCYIVSFDRQGDLLKHCGKVVGFSIDVQRPVVWFHIASIFSVGEIETDIEEIYFLHVNLNVDIEPSAFK